MAAALIAHPLGHVLPSLTPGRTSIARRVPIGVVGVITPWNSPYVLAMRSVGPALALGNAVVLKCDPNTPVTGGVVIARIFEEAGLPSGLLHVLPGGADVGQALTEDPNVRMISFTGSTATGRSVGAAAGRRLKRLVLELGGNSPLIVLDDADLEAASSAGAWGSFLHQGQICLAVSRHLVHESIADAYLEALCKRAQRLPVGNPDTEQVALGPIINERQVQRVQRIVDDSVAAGAQALTGGRADGLFYPPTVLGAVTTEMAAFREEIFGPVAPVIRSPMTTRRWRWQTPPSTDSRRRSSRARRSAPHGWPSASARGWSTSMTRPSTRSPRLRSEASARPATAATSAGWRTSSCGPSGNG
jgi:benzaldehyde dehydrogenase (NAD)